MLKREGWLNKEVAAFLAGSSLLCGSALWCALSGPEPEEWGSVAVRAGSPDWLDLPISTSEGAEVLQRYKWGHRQNPFLLQRGRVRFRSPSLTAKSPKLVDISPRPKPVKTTRPPPKPKTKPKPKEKPKLVRQAPKPWETPMNVRGAYRIEGGGTFVFFESKETGEIWNVREGDEIPELGVKVVKVTPSIIIVENEKGKRFRLQDLIRRAGEKE